MLFLDRRAWVVSPKAQEEEQHLLSTFQKCRALCMELCMCPPRLIIPLSILLREGWELPHWGEEDLGS